jgi:hypothetical protein
MDVDVDAIQPGWSVFAADGQELGTVARLEAGTLIVKRSGLLGTKEFHVPRNAVSLVETGRVELSLNKHEAEHQGS